MLNLTTQHKLGVLQGLVVEQPVQFCPLCWGVAVLVLHSDAVDRKDSAIFKQGFHSVGVHAEEKPKRVLNKRETMLAQQKQQVIKDAFSN